MSTGQLDLFSEIDETSLDISGPTLYSSPTRGLAARTTEFESWCDQYGVFSSFMRSHAWTVSITCPSDETERCQPTVLCAELRCDHWEDCCCVGDLMYRGACRGCDWEGQPCNRENRAAEDAHDHAWPGWRDLPIVPGIPDDKKKRAAWIDSVSELCPAGWLERGGPIRTGRRTDTGTRHVPSRTPFGGYDLGVLVAA